MSSMLASISCYLENKEIFTRRNLTLATVLDHENGDAREECHRTNDRFSMKELLKSTHTTADFWNYIAVIRDPVDRFLSGFVDKCIRERVRYKKAYGSVCYRCGTNMGCFLDVQYKRAQKIARGKLRPKKWRMEDLHFLPQSWYCDFSTNLRRYTLLRYPGHDAGQMEQFTDHLLKLLKERGVPDDTLDTIRTSLLEENTSHATFEMKERRAMKERLTSSPRLMQKLLRLYQSDYEMFGFELPCTQDR
ncbi:Protein Y48G1BL.7 [Aphelenchoides avenae]|nr:Protein Y48G1BL.7 [Aphelenchus avenae]